MSNHYYDHEEEEEEEEKKSESPRSSGSPDVLKLERSFSNLSVVSAQSRAGLRNVRMSLSKANSFRLAPAETLAMEQQHFLSQSFSHFDEKLVVSSPEEEDIEQDKRKQFTRQQQEQASNNSLSKSSKKRRPTGAGTALARGRHPSSSASPNQRRSSASPNASSSSMTPSRSNSFDLEQDKPTQSASSAALQLALQQQETPQESCQDHVDHMLKEQMSGLSDDDLKLLIQDLEQEDNNESLPKQRSSQRHKSPRRKRRPTGASGALSPNPGRQSTRGKRLSRVNSFQHSKKDPCPSVTPCPKTQRSLSRSFSHDDTNGSLSLMEQMSGLNDQELKTLIQELGQGDEPAQPSQQSNSSTANRRYSQQDVDHMLKEQMSGLSDEDLKLLIQDLEEAEETKGPSQRPSQPQKSPRRGRRPTGALSPNPGRQSAKGRRLSRVNSFQHAKKDPCPSVAPCNDTKKSLNRSFSHDSSTNNNILMMEQKFDPNDEALHLLMQDTSTINPATSSRRDSALSRGRSFTKRTSNNTPRPTSIKPIPPMEPDNNNQSTKPTRVSRRQSSMSPNRRTSMSPSANAVSPSPRRRKSSMSPPTPITNNGRRQSSVSPNQRVSAAMSPEKTLIAERPSTLSSRRQSTVRKSVRASVRQSAALRGKSHSPKRTSSRPSLADYGKSPSAPAPLIDMYMSDSDEEDNNNKKAPKPKTRPSWAPAPLIDMEMSDSSSSEGTLDLRSSFLRRRSSFRSESSGANATAGTSKPSDDDNNKRTSMRKSKSFRQPRPSQARILRKSFAHPAPLVDADMSDSEDEGDGKKKATAAGKTSKHKDDLKSSRHEKGRHESRNDLKSSRHDKRRSPSSRDLKSSRHHSSRHLSRHDSKRNLSRERSTSRRNLKDHRGESSRRLKDNSHSERNDRRSHHLKSSRSSRHLKDSRHQESSRSLKGSRDHESSRSLKDSRHHESSRSLKTSRHESSRHLKESRHQESSRSLKASRHNDERYHRHDRSSSKREKSPRRSDAGEVKTSDFGVPSEIVERFIEAIGDIHSDDFWIKMVVHWESLG